MVKHVILWKLDESRTAEEKEEIKNNMKLHLEALIGKVPGLLEMKINIHPLASSNVDVMLDAILKDEEALKNYAVHPGHVAAADTYVRPYTVQYVLVTREGLPNLPYSVEEIYGIRHSGKYAGLKQVFNEVYRIYGRRDGGTTGDVP